MIRRIMIRLLILASVAIIGSCCLFVDQAEHVYVTQFGEHVATYNGQTDAGFHWKLPWPIQSAIRLDRRLQLFDVPTQELLIRDRDPKSGEEKPLPLTFDLYVCWRIADSSNGSDPVDQFVRSFGTLEKAQSYLRSQIISRLKVELSDILLAELVNTDATKLRTDDMLKQIRTRPFARTDGETPSSLVTRSQQVGIEIIDIRLRRFNHPVQVRDEIFAKIRKDREREANNYRLQGEELARTILNEGVKEAGRIRTDAEAEKKRLEGKAHAESVRILNEAHQVAPEFYRIVRLLEGYKQMFADDKTQLILSLDHPLLALFRDLPKLQNGSSESTGNGAKKPNGRTP
jgi:membrane protease subunit HflC